MAKTISFALISPPGESPYVSISYAGYLTEQADNQVRVYDTEKVVIKRDLNSDSFSLVINGVLFITFLESEVTAPAHTDANDLHDKLCALFGKNPSVSVLIPNPLPITGNVDVDNFPAEFGVVNGSTPLHVTVDSVSPNPLPVTGTINVGNWPSPFNVAVSNFPATYPVTGTVSVSNLPAIQTVNGVVSTLQSGVLLKRFPLLLNVPQLVKVGATEIFYVKVINSGGTGTRQYVKLCDTVAAPTVGVTPVLSTFDGPANATNFVHYIDTPINAVNGIWVYSVRGILDSDATAPASGCICEIGYR